MSKVELKYSKKLVYTNLTDDDIRIYYVLVSHSELDTLVGRLMQMCDLTGDMEQRKALKSTIKTITREWLDELYQESGCDKWDGPQEGARIIKD